VAADPEGPWFIYALGGGLGHLNRALALARQAGKLGVSSLVLTNSPYVELVYKSVLWQDELSKSVELILVPQHATHRNLAGIVAAQLERTKVSRVIVDTFPRGIAGELAELLPALCKKEQLVLVARDITPRYVKEYQLIDFIKHHYALVVNPGDHSSSSLATVSVPTEPWLIRDSEEMRLLQVPYSDSRILISYSGMPDESLKFEQLMSVLMQRFPREEFSCLCPGDFSPAADLEVKLPRRYTGAWPGMDYVAKAKVVIGGGGYNLIAECRALAVSIISMPQRRLYDRQDTRARINARHVANTVQEVVSQLSSLLLETIGCRQTPVYTNGAAQATRMIASM
jgi:hypothetical protein